MLTVAVSAGNDMRGHDVTERLMYRAAVLSGNRTTKTIRAPQWVPFQEFKRRVLFFGCAFFSRFVFAAFARVVVSQRAAW